MLRKPLVLFGEIRCWSFLYGIKIQYDICMVTQANEKTLTKSFPFLTRRSIYNSCLIDNSVYVTFVSTVKRFPLKFTYD